MVNRPERRLVMLRLDVPPEVWLFDGMLIAWAGVQCDGAQIEGPAMIHRGSDGLYWAAMGIYRTFDDPKRYIFVEETVGYEAPDENHIFKATTDVGGNVFREARPLVDFIQNRATAGDYYQQLVASLLHRAAMADADIALEVLVGDPQAFEEFMNCERPAP